MIKRIQKIEKVKEKDSKSTVFGLMDICGFETELVAESARDRLEEVRSL